MIRYKTANDVHPGCFALKHRLKTVKHFPDAIQALYGGTCLKLPVYARQFQKAVIHFCLKKPTSEADQALATGQNMVIL